MITRTCSMIIMLCIVRRKPETLLRLEVEILATVIAAQRFGQPRFHGFELAKALAEGAGARSLT
ncbi:MAG TPA: hypothetical protein VK923_06975 [Euzebyales bacterium]|nr:hypothetical protein [Euzebyales bacterium]